MCNSTFYKSGFSRLIFLIVFFLLNSYSVSAQFYSKHYIAPAPWQYFSKANEIVISTNSLVDIDITITKSDGTAVTTLTAKKGKPAVYRFTLLARNLPMNALNTVLNGAGLIVTSTGPTAVNLRNIASDDYKDDENRDANIKGNAALTSFGDAGLGIRFRVGYYRDGSLGSFSTFGEQRPIYSIMATANNTTIKINNAVVTTLNQGQSYLFKANIGTLVESSNPIVMNTSAAIDMPGGCGDGAFNQIPPESVLGTEYFLERGTGNDTAEQTTVVATKDDTALTVQSFTTAGVLVPSLTKTVILKKAGDFFTFVNGVSVTNFTTSRISADKRVAVYSGTAQNCEVDISSIAPVSECGGSEFVETTKFKSYSSGNLDYFGYILLRSASEDVKINGVKTTDISGIGARFQIGSTGWYIINFNSEKIGRPEVLSIESKAKLTVSIVQQAGGFSMAGFFSTFAALPGDPGLTYIEGGGCTNNSAELTTPPGFAPYQWYYNGTAISGANSPTYVATKTGNYSVSSTLVCGAQTPSKTVAVALCTDLGITKTVDNATPCVGSNVEFTVKVSNLGGNNVSGISVTDLLPSGYTYVSSTPLVGVYNSTTGVWTIGDVEAQTSMTLKIVATVNASGNYTNTASLPNGIDTNAANNSASAAVSPKSPNLVITNPASVCGPSTIDLTASSITAGSSSGLTLSYWTNAGATTVLSSPNAVVASGTYYIKAVSSDGCSVVKAVVVTVNPQPNTPSITSRTTNATIVDGSISCFGGSSITLRAPSSSGYLWSTGDTTRDITVTTDGTYSVKVSNSSNCISDSSSAVSVTFASAPVASDQSFCASENKKVSDLVATGTNLKWYSAATNGTQYAANALLTAGNYFVSQTPANGCESTRTQVKVTISSSSAPVASAQTFCFAENKKISDLVATGTNLKWYNASTNGTQYSGTETLVTGNYYVSQTAGTCQESARTLVAVTINNIPSPPTASSQIFCGTDSKTVNDLIATGTNLKWYNALTNGTQYSGTETLLSGNYFVSQTNSCGESTRRTVSVTVNNTAAPTVSAQTFCSVELKRVSDLSPSGASYKWYSANTGGTLYLGNEILVTATYYVSQITNGCESLRRAVSVIVNETPVAPSAVNQVFCSGENKIVNDLKVTSGSNLKWYNASIGGTQYLGSEILTSSNYYVSQTINNCESGRTLVGVTVNPTPATPTISTEQSTTFCQGESITLKSSGGSAYLWSTGETTESITVSASGNYSVRVTNATGCPSSFSSPITITVNPIPTPPTASTQTFCSSENKKVSDLTVTSGSDIKWYAASTGGSALDLTDVLTTKTYYVSQTTNGCESSRTSVSVTVNQTPTAPALSAITQPTCLASTGSFIINNYNPAYNYTITPSAGVKNNSGTITAPTGSYTISVSSNGCSSDDVSFVINSILCANEDQFGTKASESIAVNIGNVKTNDTLNGVAVTDANTVVKIGSNGPLSGDTNGDITLTANTPSGKYSIIYEICEKGANPANCKTATAEVKVVNAIDAVIDSIDPINGNIGGTTISLISNDTFKNTKAVIGTNAGEVAISIVGTLPSGLALNANGTITVSPNTPKGNYSIEYKICEVGAVPANCDSVTITVPVTAGNLVANADEIPSVLGSDVPQILGKNVFDNDTKNAQPLNPSDVTLKTTTSDPKGYLTLKPDGSIVLGANPPAGEYELTYEICEKLNLDNCSSNTVKVTVSIPAIDAVKDVIASINGNIGGKTISLIGNDTLNGNPITVGTAAGEVKFEIIGTLSTGLSLNSDYTITVAPNTPKGDYEVEYKICENTNPLNCDSVTITVPVTAGNLVANADEIPSVLGLDVPQTLGKNVFDNDTKNGQPLDPADVTLKTTTSDPKGYLTLKPDGSIVLGANPPAGDYELTYEICEKLNLDNCSSNTVKVTVSIPVIDAVKDLIASINGNIGGKTISLISNDTLNGNPITVGTGAGEVKFEIIGTLPTGLSLNSDYTITVAPNTPKGDYEVEYKICENTNPLNCDSVIITVPVTAGNLVANADEIPSVLGSDVPQTLGKNVFDNDTKNAQPLNPSDVTLKTTTSDPKGYVTLKPDGSIVLGANPPAGDYELTYEICEKLNLDNCSSNTVKVTVSLPLIDAVEDVIASINGNIGGKTISLISNDTLNGNPIKVGKGPGEVKFEIIGTLPTGLSLNSDYTITVAPNTPKGDYEVEYKICENTNPLNCDSVTITVPVTAGNLVANADEIPSVLGSDVPQTLGKNVFDNDTKNGQPLDPADVTLKTTTSDPKGYLTLKPDGSIVLGANPPAGDYELTYEICEKLNLDNCSSNTVKVTVSIPVIDAVEDVIASINGNIGGKTISLISNDTLNGNPITVGTAAGEVKFEIIGTLPTGLSLNSDYTITVAPNTPAANYNVEYKICENTNPLNCDSVISVVPVKGSKLVANEDLVPAVGVNVPQEVINVFANDTKDGNVLVSSDVNLNVTKTDPKGYLTVDANGNVILAPNAPAGGYELTYEICEKLNSNNCDSNVVKVTVAEPKMTVVANSYCSNNAPYVNYTVTPDNFTTNNLLTIKWIDSNNNVVATQTNLQLSGNILWPGAQIDTNGNGVDWPGWILNNGIWIEGVDGFEATRNGVRMEFSLNPTVTVTVAYPPTKPDCNARPTFSIKANNDETGPINVKKGANATVNIFENDLLNGAEIKPSDVILSVPVVNPNFSLNANGSINIAANTPDGVYELTYQICEAANTSNCSQAVIKITIDNVADPVSPTANEITLNNDNDASVDGINGSLEFINVLENDLINGQPINPADVILKPLIPDAYFEWNADGTVSVKPNTPGNTYTLTYQVCEKANPTNCSTATLSVFVEVPAISVVKTAVFNDENKSGFANAGETITYKFTVTNTGNVPLVGITINDPLPGVVVSGQAINLGVNESNETNFTAVYKITQEDINRGSVSNQATVKGSSVRGIVVEDKSDDVSNSGDNPTVLDLNGCSIKVLNAFSPNGDSKNARFYIRGIECYPDNTVEIYNRWGVLVFNIDKYNNNDRVFVGYSNGRSTIKQTDGLPVGTYFYVLKYKDGAQNSHQESGYLYLNK